VPKQEGGRTKESAAGRCHPLLDQLVSGCREMIFDRDQILASLISHEDRRSIDPFPPFVKWWMLSEESAMYFATGVATEPIRIGRHRTSSMLENQEVRQTNRPADADLWK